MTPDELRAEARMVDAEEGTDCTTRAALLRGAAQEIERLRGLLQSVLVIAGEGFDYWDADKDSKVGKLLNALSGGIPGYRHDIDKIVHAANGNRS